MKVLSNFLPTAAVALSAVGSLQAFTILSPSSVGRVQPQSLRHLELSALRDDDDDFDGIGSFNDDDDDQGRYYDALALNKARTDAKNFLTQRAIQSFIFLLISCRDPHTVGWLENTYDFKGLDNFHGTGALNLTKFGTWDALFLDMLDQPPAVVVVRVQSRGRGKRGTKSKRNPYLQEKHIEFEIDIDPVSLVSRIISVRDQIAKEWEQDLDTMIMANDMILDSYHEHHVAARAETTTKPEKADPLPLPLPTTPLPTTTTNVLPVPPQATNDNNDEEKDGGALAKAKAKDDEEDKNVPTKVKAKTADDEEEPDVPATVEAGDGDEQDQDDVPAKVETKLVNDEEPDVPAKVEAKLVNDEEPDVPAKVEAKGDNDEDDQDVPVAEVEALDEDSDKELDAPATEVEARDEGEVEKDTPAEVHAEDDGDDAEETLAEVEAKDDNGEEEDFLAELEAKDDGEEDVFVDVEAKDDDNDQERDALAKVEANDSGEEEDALVDVEAMDDDKDQERDFLAKVEAKDSGEEEDTPLEVEAKGDNDGEDEQDALAKVEARDDDDDEYYDEDEKAFSALMEAKDDDDDEDSDDFNVADLTAPYSDASSREMTPPNSSSDKQEGRRAAFERIGMMMLNNAMVASSPLRKGNFDLLCLLATQESIHRVLREYRQAGDEREVSYEWLREFYTSRVASHFDGNQGYGRGDDFLEDLLTSPPTMKELEGSKGGKTQIGFIDPLRVAEDIIRMRSVVANDWKRTISGVGKDHMELRRHVLIKQMGNAVNPSPFDAFEIQEVENESPKKQIFIEDGFQ